MTDVRRYRQALLGLSVLLGCAAGACARTDGHSGYDATWGAEPVVERSPVRGQIVLNGPWQFMPADGPTQAQPNEQWGWIRVPGNWAPGWTGPGILIDCPDNPFWNKYYGVGRDETGKPKVIPKGARQLETMWYQRRIDVPEAWKDRAILVDVRWLSTDAVVYIDGEQVGGINWPTGQVDITEHLTPGQSHTLRMKVAAVADEGFTWTSMGTEQGMATRKKKHLQSRGLVGDVLLVSRPKGAIVSDVFVQTSTRKGQVALDIEVTGIKQAGDVSITAEMVNAEGKTEKRFKTKQQLDAEPAQRFMVTFDWPDAKRWNVQTPHLYTVQLHVEGQAIADVYPQRFGFREFWIDGREIYLNGKPFRLRPWGTSHLAMPTARLWRAAFEDIKALGSNITEIWPNELQRGIEYHDDLFYRLADEVGLAVMGRASSIGGLIREGQWENPQARAEWFRPVQVAIRRSRNCPSVVMWDHTGNFFGYANDISPQMMGMKGVIHDPDILAKYRRGEQACDLIRALDPTRPVITHHGGYVGELHTANHYLNLIPLQEREEWMSHHVDHADMPYCGIEFGSPDELTFHRNRQFHAKSKVSEPWHTEFAAIYLGPEAYRLETVWQRGDLRGAYKETVEHKNAGDLYRWWDWRYATRYDSQPNFQKVLELFLTNTHRSWRAAGHTGGVLNWSGAHGWENEDTAGNPADPRPWHEPEFEDRIVRDEWEPGTRGPWQPYAPKSSFHPFSAEHQTELPAGRAVRANNQPTLAYIAGAPSFYDKDHLFYSGQTVNKQVVVINDTRQAQKYELTITASVGGKQITEIRRSAAAQVGQNVFEKIAFDLPASISDEVVDGRIELRATIGSAKHADVFPFRVHARSPEFQAQCTVYDPIGNTRAMLQALGYDSMDWTTDSSSKHVIIGREVLSRGKALPSDLAGFVRDGGRVLVMQQDPQWLRGCGWRVSRHVERRAWPVLKDHPVTGGLTGEDLRDWSGSGTLVAERDEVTNGQSPVPPFGWRWGNRGSVSSGAIEKPHHAGWTPLIECGFDLQYTPLMELRHGRGLIVWCQLDLEDNVTADDPVARRIATRLVDYVRADRDDPIARRPAVYLGDQTHAKLLSAMGLSFDRAERLDVDQPSLAIIGPGAKVTDEQLKAFGDQGGNVLFLGLPSGDAPLGVKIAPTPAVPKFKPGRFDRHSVYNLALPEELKKLFCGATEVPDWPEAAGISVSEVRIRTYVQADIVSDGAETGANGLLARKPLGRGVAIFCQMDPTDFDVEAEPYLRFTRWRQRRAIAQLLSNLGATFEADAAMIAPSPTRLPLAGDMWKIKLTDKLPPVAGWPNRLKSRPMTELAERLVKVGVDDSDWQQVRVPDAWSSYGSQWRDMEGEAVYRRSINLPRHWAGQDLVLELGRFVANKQTLRDQDDTFFNGQQVGSGSDYWVDRSYVVPGKLVQPGANLLSIRLASKIGGGGIFSMPQDLYIRLKDASRPNLYHPDYRDDWIEGDEPYRWVRW